MSIDDRMRRASVGLDAAANSIEVPPMEELQQHARKRATARLLTASAVVLAVIAGAAFVIGRRDDGTSSGLEHQPTAKEVGPFVLNPSDTNDPHNRDSHWHAALGVYDCDHWMGDGAGDGVWRWPAATPEGSPARVDEPNVYAGLHSHGDGIVHMEPETKDDAGANATLGRYFEEGGWNVSAKAFTFLGTTRHAGDTCGGAPGDIVFMVNGKVVPGNPATYKLYNDDKLVLAFVRPGQNVAANPPSVKNLPDAQRPGAGPTYSITVGPNGSLTYSPSTLKVTDTFDIRLKVSGAAGHTLVFDNPDVVVGPKPIETNGKTQTYSVSFPGPGTYTFFCKVPGHRAAGMQGKIDVVETAGLPPVQPGAPPAG